MPCREVTCYKVSALVHKYLQFVTLDSHTMMTRDEWMRDTAKLLARQITQSLLFDPLQTRGTMKNPNELWGSDNASFVTVRDYLHAVRTHQAGKVSFLRSNNPGLLEYFLFVDLEVTRNPYYDL